MVRVGVRARVRVRVRVRDRQQPHLHDINREELGGWECESPVLH